MEPEILETIMKWLAEPIMESNNLKYLRTEIENNDPVIYASIRYNHTSNGYTKLVNVERRIHIKNISVKDLQEQLDDIINLINVN